MNTGTGSGAERSITIFEKQIKCRHRITLELPLNLDNQVWSRPNNNSNSETHSQAGQSQTAFSLSARPRCQSNPSRWTSDPDILKIFCPGQNTICFFFFPSESKNQSQHAVLRYFTFVVVVLWTGIFNTFFIIIALICKFLYNQRNLINKPLQLKK